jgi:hypothetical protein
MAQSLNLANGNACALLALAGLPPAPFGEVDHSDLAPVIARLLRAVNSKRARVDALCADATSPSGRWTEAGRSEAYVSDRVSGLLALCREAQVNGCRLVWG